MNPLAFLKGYKDNLLRGSLPELATTTALVGGGTIAGINALSNREQPRMDLTNPNVVQYYGNPMAAPQQSTQFINGVPVQSPTMNPNLVAVDPSTDVQTPTNIPLPVLSEGDIANQKRFLSRKIATDLITLRQLENMQKTIEGNIYA